MENSNEIGFKLSDLLKEMSFGIKNFGFMTNREIEEIRSLLKKPYLISFFNMNDFIVSYPEKNHEFILKKIRHIDQLCCGRFSEKKFDKITEEIYIELIVNKKNSYDEITENHFRQLGEWMTDDFLLLMAEEILLFKNKISYIELFSNNSFLSHFTKNYIDHQIKNKKTEKKFYLYELNIIFDKLKSKIDTNIKKLVKNKEMSVFADRSVYQRYCLDNKKYSLEYIYDNESIFNFMEPEDLDLLVHIMPEYFYYLFIKEDRVNQEKDKTINYVYKLIRENIEGLNDLSPANIKSMKKYLD